MTHLPNLEELDTDGAIREVAEQVDGDTRASFLRKAGVGVGAALAGGTVLGALPALAGAATIPASDIAILNFALTLEYLEAEFYAQANENKKLTDKETIRFSTVVAQHEASHVAFLKKVLGAKAVAKPTFDFKDTVTDQ